MSLLLNFATLLPSLETKLFSATTAIAMNEMRTNRAANLSANTHNILIGVALSAPPPHCTYAVALPLPAWASRLYQAVSGLASNFYHGYAFIPGARHHKWCSGHGYAQFFFHLQELHSGQ